MSSSLKPLLHQPQPVWPQHFSSYCFLGNPVPILSHVGGGRAAKRKGLLAGGSGPSPSQHRVGGGWVGDSGSSHFPLKPQIGHSHGHRAEIPLGLEAKERGLLMSTRPALGITRSYRKWGASTHTHFRRGVESHGNFPTAMWPPGNPGLHPLPVTWPLHGTQTTPTQDFPAP